MRGEGRAGEGEGGSEKRVREGGEVRACYTSTLGCCMHHSKKRKENSEREGGGAVGGPGLQRQANSGPVKPNKHAVNAAVAHRDRAWCATAIDVAI